MRGLVAVLTLLLTALARPDLPAFQSLVSQAKMVYSLPQGFEVVPSERYGLVTRNAEKTLEIRYVVHPLAEDMEAYQKARQPGSQATYVDPNKIFSSIILVAAANISGQPPNPDGADHFPPDAVKQEFGADDGMTTAVRVADPEFSKDYQICVITVLQKNDVAYALTYALANDPEVFEKVFARDDVFHALRFR